MMSHKQQIVRDFWRKIASLDWDGLQVMFHPEAEISWPNTAETFTPDTYVMINRNYPGKWKLDLERIEETNAHIISVTRIKSLNEAVSLRAISIFGFQENAIISLTEYFADDTAIPEWRRNR